MHPVLFLGRLGALQLHAPLAKSMRWPKAEHTLSVNAFTALCFRLAPQRVQLICLQHAGSLVRCENRDYVPQSSSKSHLDELSRPIGQFGKKEQRPTAG